MEVKMGVVVWYKLHTSRLCGATHLSRARRVTTSTASNVNTVGHDEEEDDEAAATDRLTEAAQR